MCRLPLACAGCNRLHAIGCRTLVPADCSGPTLVIGWARKPCPLLACDWLIIAQNLLLIGRTQLRSAQAVQAECAWLLRSGNSRNCLMFLGIVNSENQLLFLRIWDSEKWTLILRMRNWSPPCVVQRRGFGVD